MNKWVDYSIGAAFIGGLLAFGWYSTPARAESFFQAEVGLGASYTIDRGDGIWYQLGLPHKENLYAPVYTAGFTGTVYDHGPWSVHYHLDYFYTGPISASCDCVPDQNYNPSTHTTVGKLPPLSPFNGQGHTQGVALTIEPGYTYKGYRFSIEGGPTLYWTTWHESLDGFGQPGQWHDLSHKTTMQVGWVAGARVSHGPWSLVYRVYKTSGSGNPYPSLSTLTHTLSITFSLNIF